MHREIDERNRASLERLRALSARLSEEELLRPVDPPWTASALYAHVAFWDRFSHARWRRAAEAGADLPASIDDEPLDLVNDAALRQWTLVPPRAAVEECLSAAEEINGLVSSLDDEVVARTVGQGRERLVDRSIHRLEHLGAMERAFPEAAEPSP